MEAVGCVNLGGAKVIVVMHGRIYHGWVTSCGSGERRWRHDKEGRGGEWWWSHAVKVQGGGGGREETRLLLGKRRVKRRY